MRKQNLLTLFPTYPRSAPRLGGLAGDKLQDHCKVCASRNTCSGALHILAAKAGLAPSAKHRSSPGLRRLQSGWEYDSSLVSLARSPLPTPRPRPSPSALCVAAHTQLLPIPKIKGASRKLKFKPLIGNLAGLQVTGVLHTRCTELKETIMQRVQRGALIHLGNRSLPIILLTSLLPSLPRPLRLRQQWCPWQEPALSFSFTWPQGSSGTTFSEMFPARCLKYPPEMMRKCFLHPFLIAADYNYILWEINT